VRRHLQGLHSADESVAKNLPHGFLLVRVVGVRYRWNAFKPYYLVRLSIVEPKEIAGTDIASSLYCTPKSLWKLNWFLRDFGYDRELLGRDEIDETLVVGLQGVIKIGDGAVSGTYLLNLEGFAPASEWPQISRSFPSPGVNPEVRR
jgi:hypothetical protein